MRYGARLTHRWKGRLLTAFAATVLLAASAGTAWAQTGVTITGPAMNTVTEGGTATYTVTVRGYVDAAADAMTPTAASTVTVSLATPTPAAQTGTTDGEAVDLNTNLHVLAVSFDTPANSSLTTPRLFTASKTISVVTLHDNDAENEGYTLAFSLDAAGGLDTGADNDTEIALATPGTAANPNVLIIDDDETQTYTLSIAANARPREGAALTVTGRAVPAHVQGSSGALDLYTDPARGYTLPDPAQITIGTAAITFTIMQDAGDGNRVPDTVTLSAYMSTPGPGADTLVASLPITFADANVLPAVEVVVTTEGGTPLDPQPTSVAEGESVHVKATAVDRDGDPEAFGEQLTIKLVASAAGTADARDIVAPGNLTIGADATNSASATESNVVELTIFDPDDDVGLERLVLNAIVSGSRAQGTETSTSSAVLTLEITDETDPLIWALPEDEAYPKITNAIDAGDGADDVLNPYPQESFTVDMSGLFGVAMGYRGSYTATVDSTAVSLSSTGTMLTVTADHEGEAKVTITGTAASASSSAFSSDQSIANVASISFDVTVEDSELTVTVAAVPDAIDEGGTSEITATANRMVTSADGSVTINLTVVGDATLDAESITIAAGSESGSATLTAGVDDDTNDETVTVIASGPGIDGNMQVEVAVNDTTEVPAPANAIEPKATDVAYPVITGAIEEAAGDEGLNPGESFSLSASDLFTVSEGYTAAYAVTVEGTAISASASGDTVSVAAEMAGEATVTITGTARAAASSLEPSQTSTHTAELKFPVTVVDKALMLTWYVGQGGDDYNVENLVEGQEYEIIVNANRAISEAEGSVEVTFMRDRAASDADDSDYTVGVATLRAGRDHAHVRPPLMVLADDISEGGTDDGGNVGEQLVLFGVASNGAPVMADPEHFSTENGALTIWDTAVPALPVIATWLLGLGLLGGGARQMYLRRRQE